MFLRHHLLGVSAYLNRLLHVNLIMKETMRPHIEVLNFLSHRVLEILQRSSMQRHHADLRRFRGPVDQNKGVGRAPIGKVELV